MTRLAVVGPPGAGKTALAQALRAEYGVPAISTGAMLRAAREAGSLSPDAAERYDRGELMPVGLVDEMLTERLRGLTGWVLDGYPRRREEAEMLVQGVLPRPQAVIVLIASAELAASRISKRGSCPEHGVVTAGPGGTCPSCGAHLARRPEDDPMILLRRRCEYDANLAGVVAVLGELVIELQAELALEDLVEVVKEAI